MLKPTDVYRSENFIASLTDDPSGIWYLDVSCKTERNGVTGRIVGHIPLCLKLEDQPDGSQEAVLSVMDDIDEEEAEETEEKEAEEEKKEKKTIFAFHPRKK